MSFFASVNGLQVVAGRLVVPSLGIWTADLELAGEGPLDGAASVVVGNLTLVGFVVRSSVYGGQVQARIVGGNGGWRTVVPAQGYGNAGGVNLSTILSDVAAACGETINVPVDLSVGNAYTRTSGVDDVASDVLADAVKQGYIPGWYVDTRGVTQASTWPVTTVSTPFTVTDQRPDEGVIVVATEDYASWLPGAQFTDPTLLGSWTCSGVSYVWEADGKFRLEILTATPSPTSLTTAPASLANRLLAPLIALIAWMLAPTRFYGRYRYKISNPTATTVDATPWQTPAGTLPIGLPDLTGVRICGDSLATYTPPDGGECHIQFLDGLRSQPICVWTEADSENGPSSLTLAPSFSAAMALARVGDTVVVEFPPAMQISGLQGLPIPTEPFIGILTITTPAVGTVSTGSQNASST